jgi:small-conductance mechanosensitive channel
VIMKTLPGQQFDVNREMNVRLKEALDAAGIEIPFPQQTTWVRQAGDRPSPEQPSSDEGEPVEQT